MAPGRAEALLGDGDQVDVVLVLHRHRQERGQLVQQGGGVPAGQVRGVPQPPGARVERPRGADDDPVDVGAGEARVLHRPVERVGDLAHHAVGAPPGGGQFELPDGPPGHVRDGGGDAPPVHVEPGHMGGARVHRVELGVGSGASLAGPGGHDEPGGFQPGQQLGRGGLGEPGQLPDPGPGQRPVLQQQIQRGPVVHGPQDPRGARCAGGTGSGSRHRGCTALCRGDRPRLC